MPHLHSFDLLLSHDSISADAASTAVVCCSAAAAAPGWCPVLLSPIAQQARTVLKNLQVILTHGLKHLGAEKDEYSMLEQVIDQTE